MPVYKDPKKKTWFVGVPVKKPDGSVSKTTKRGFAKKTDALAWEREYLCKSDIVDITFEELAEAFKEDRFPRMKESTRDSLNNIINNKLVPVFGKKKVKDITTLEVNRWQNSYFTGNSERTGKPYKKSYVKRLSDALSLLMNYAAQKYGLAENPVDFADMISEVAEGRMKFWTQEEYQKFAETIRDDVIAYISFETLYWTGMREGELMALTWQDFDLEKKIVSISKTMHLKNGTPVVTDPKTAMGNRKITLPEKLCDELKEYREKSICSENEDQVFPVAPYKLYRRMRTGCRKAGLNPIRIHDLRHSHVSLLIHLGFSAVDIAKRLGHESTEITFRYAHLFPSEQDRIAEDLDRMRVEMNNDQLKMKKEN